MRQTRRVLAITLVTVGGLSLWTACSATDDGASAATADPAVSSTPKAVVSMPGGRTVCTPTSELSTVRPDGSDPLAAVTSALAYEHLHDNDPAVRRDDPEVLQCAADLLAAVLANPQNQEAGFSGDSIVDSSDTVRLPLDFDSMVR